MLKLMKRILAVSGKYKGRIQLAFVFSFLKSLLAKAPIMLAFLALAGFYQGSVTQWDCLWIGISMIACLLLQVLFHHIADRLQSAAGFQVFSDMRMNWAPICGGCLWAISPKETSVKSVPCFPPTWCLSRKTA